MKEKSKITSATSGETEIVILDDDGESFSVLVREKDDETGKTSERKATLSHAAFESGVKSGLLQKK